MKSPDVICLPRREGFAQRIATTWSYRIARLAASRKLSGYSRLYWHMPC